MVPRQGDWFFVPAPHFTPAAVRRDVAYGRHVIEEWSRGHARGLVRHGEHEFLQLDGWYRTCRCRGWHSFKGAPAVHNQAYWVRRLSMPEAPR
jgi:hypothetical protein